jgi:hypothetical protein
LSRYVHHREISDYLRKMGSIHIRAFEFSKAAVVQIHMGDGCIIWGLKRFKGRSKYEKLVDRLIIPCFEDIGQEIKAEVGCHKRA